MYRITPVTVLAVVLFFASLFTVIRIIRPRITAEERKTFLVIGVAWAVSVFIANYLLFRAGLMSFLPWVNNFLHTFPWIGFCLAWLYLGVREDQSMVTQMIAFATFSLAVKVVEHAVFGTWDHEHFFHQFKGNAAYIIGWSVADGLYPPITFYGLRMVSRFVRGLVVL